MMPHDVRNRPPATGWLVVTSFVLRLFSLVFRNRLTPPDLNNAQQSQGQGQGQGQGQVQGQGQGQVQGQVGDGGNEDTRHQQPLPPPPPPPPTIAIDDEVVETSATEFAQATRRSRRNHERTQVVRVNVNLEDRTTRITQHNCRRVPRENVTTTRSVPKSPLPPPPPKEPTFSCPICMGPLVEEMSTKCGHIFCKACIKAAITASGKCPFCRKKVTARELIRVFLPATR